MEYTIVIKKRLHELEEIVNSYIKRGWEPIGGPFLSEFGNPAQAMVKKANG